MPQKRFLLPSMSVHTSGFQQLCHTHHKLFRRTCRLPAIRASSFWGKDRQAEGKRLGLSQPNPKVWQDVALKVSSCFTNIKLSKARAKPQIEQTYATTQKSSVADTKIPAMHKGRWSTLLLASQGKKLNFLIVAVQERVQVCEYLSVSHTRSQLPKRLQWSVCHLVLTSSSSHQDLHTQGMGVHCMESQA